MNFLIVEVNNKQYYTKVGNYITVDFVEKEVGEKIKVKVLAKMEDGKINLSNELIDAEILEHKKSEKIFSFKKNRRKRYTRKKGHRSLLTKIRIL